MAFRKMSDWIVEVRLVPLAISPKITRIERFSDCMNSIKQETKAFQSVQSIQGEISTDSRYQPSPTTPRSKCRGGVCQVATQPIQACGRCSWQNILTLQSTYQNCVWYSPNFLCDH